MQNNNYNRIVRNTIDMLNKVNVTGIDESTMLVECANFLSVILKGDLTIVETSSLAQEVPSIKED
jgi:hypothetical protein